MKIMENNHLTHIKHATKRKLCSVYLEMAARMPLNKIRVGKLSELSGINRQSFYYHYDSLDDLLVEIYLALIHDELVWIKEDHQWTTHLTGMVNALYENQVFVTRMYNELGPVNFSYIVIQIVHYLIDISVTSEEKEVVYLDYLAGFYGSGLATVLMRWIAEGMVENAYRLSDMLKLFIEHGYSISVFGTLKS